MSYFFSKKALPNYIIWSVTMLPAYFIKFSDLGKSRSIIYYLIIECLIWFTLGVILTAGIHFILNITGEKSSLKNKVLYLFFSMLLASVVFNLVFWPVLDFFYEYFTQQQNYHGKFATRIFNWFNWVIWFVSITAIELFYKVKQANIQNITLQNTLKEAQLNTLKGQLNPHFMFNSLNNIKGLMLEDIPRARNMLTSLSETLRYSLRQSTTNTIDLETELEMVEKYIDLCKIQFENRLCFRTNIDEKSLKIFIPPMLIQMLIENAIKHGISNLKSGGEIVLTTLVDKKVLFITIQNSGSLMKHTKTTQLGIKNIKKRLNLLYGDEANFVLKEHEGKVIVTIEIPLS